MSFAVHFQTGTPEPPEAGGPGNAPGDEPGDAAHRAGERSPTAVREVHVAEGVALIDAVQQAGLPIARACGSDGLCARCGLLVIEGAASLSPESDEEREAKRRNRIDPAERLACQARVHGPLVATARYW